MIPSARFGGIVQSESFQLTQAPTCGKFVSAPFCSEFIFPFTCCDLCRGADVLALSAGPIRKAKARIFSLKDPPHLSPPFGSLWNNMVPLSVRDHFPSHCVLHSEYSHGRGRRTPSHQCEWNVRNQESSRTFQVLD